MKVRYSATLEFENQSPVTHTGTVAASTMPTCFARAGRALAKAHPGRQWTSCVIVLLERLDTKGATS